MDEVASWCKIAIAWDNYHDRFADGELFSNNEESKLLAALILISLAEKENERLGVPDEVGWRPATTTFPAFELVDQEKQNIAALVAVSMDQEAASHGRGWHSGYWRATKDRRGIVL